MLKRLPTSSMGLVADTAADMTERAEDPSEANTSNRPNTALTPGRRPVGEGRVRGGEGNKEEKRGGRGEEVVKKAKKEGDGSPTRVGGRQMGSMGHLLHWDRTILEEASSSTFSV